MDMQCQHIIDAKIIMTQSTCCVNMSSHSSDSWYKT